MVNHSAFISELYYKSNTGFTEFVEVTLNSNQDPADYTLAFYRQSGELYEYSNAVGQVGGLLALDNSSVIVSQSLSNPNYNVYTIETRFTTAGANNGESRAIALVNTATGDVVDAYAVGNSDITLVAAPAANTVALATGGSGGSNDTTIQWNSDRVKTVATRTENSSNVVCFCPEVMLQTVSGMQRVSELEVGDLVITKDRGATAIKWIGKTSLTHDDLKYTQRLRYVSIPAGALGHGVPHAPLNVSPHHRVLLRSDKLKNAYGIDEAFVSAKHLIGLRGIAQSSSREPIDYYHLWLGSHQIVNANGAFCESFFTGATALNMLSMEQRMEWNKFASDISDVSLARPHIRGAMLRELLMLHEHQGSVLFSPEVIHS